MASSPAEAPGASTRPGSARARPIQPAAARVWERPPDWIPPRASVAELSGGIAGSVFAAVAAPLVARPVLGALGALRPPDARPVDAGEAGDPGWFGPDSVAWRVHADPSLLVAGVAAFTLQALHPLAMAGVAEHSAFSDDFLGRTQRTAEFVQGVVYGSSSRAERLCRLVRRSHGPVVGVAPDGRPYDASDPDLLDWVHVAEYAAIAAANRRFALRPMTRAELDTYVAEVAVVGERTGVLDPPRSWSGLLDSLEHHRPQLAVGEYAALGVAFLDDPPLVPGPARPVWRALWAGAIACLPPVGRRLLNLPMPNVAELAACRATLRMLGSLTGEPLDLTAAKRRLALT